MNTNPINTNARMNRIQKVSSVIRTILLVGLVVQIAAMIVGTVMCLIVISYKQHDSQTELMNCANFMVLPFAFMLTLNFFRFFTRLKEGQLFDSQTVRYLEAAGKWWISVGMVQIILGAIEAFLFKPANVMVSGHGIVAGLVIFFIAWLLREAQELQEEQKLTV